jgi:hypothetical protein
VFGFPTVPDLPASHNNFGLLDQELVFTWVQDNIAQFGDNNKVTLMVGALIIRDTCRHTRPIFCVDRANLWGASPSHLPSPAGTRPPSHRSVRASCCLVQGSLRDYVAYSGLFELRRFATAMGCTQSPGPLRLQCLRDIPVSTIRSYTNGPQSGLFTPGVDKFVFYPAFEEVLM